MHVIVMGCGSLGVELARGLEQAGHSVAAIDKDAHALARLGPAFGGTRVTGCGFARDVLVSAGVERAQGFAALTGDDQTNALAAHVARVGFRVPRVVARLVDARQAETYEHLGIATLAPDVWGARRARELLTLPDGVEEAGPARPAFGNGEVVLVQHVVPAHAAGQRLGALLAPGEVTVVALVRGGHAQVPTGGTLLAEGDVLVLSVADSARERLAEMLDGW